MYKAFFLMFISPNDKIRQKDDMTIPQNDNLYHDLAIEVSKYQVWDKEKKAPVHWSDICTYKMLKTETTYLSEVQYLKSN
jgi:hypothetical protein